jgi:DNA primase
LYRKQRLTGQWNISAASRPDMTAIDEVKSRLDIIDLISETVQLRRSGKNYTGFCPFHSNSRTPAFVVFPETQTWRCFGQCNEGGDIFRFVMKKEGWDFSEALKYLAERSGVELKPPTPQEQADAEVHAGLRSLLEDAVIFYQHILHNTTAGRQALEYLHYKRNLTDETIAAFGLGYAPHSWDAGLNYFKSKGYSEGELIAAGLVTVHEADDHAAPANQSQPAGTRLYDRFRHRILFPIRDERGRMAGFGARVVNPEDLPKFLNSPQTALFDKSRLLYGLERARKPIRTRDQAVIVEGYLDVIALHQAGYANVVSPMGTALTETQLRLLKRLTRRIVLALDADAAGDKATLRGLQIARQALDREADPVFDARGLLGHEARLQADIRVTTLPAGVDPDELVASDPTAWENVLANARPIVIHVMETLASGRDLEDPKVRSDIAGQVLPLIEDVPDPVERDTYRQRLARLIRVDEMALRQFSPSRAGGRTRPRLRPVARDAPPGSPSAPRSVADSRAEGRLSLEGHCLGVLLRRPDLVYRVDRALQERSLARLTPEDFEAADHQQLLRLVGESLEQDHSEPLNFVLNGMTISEPLLDTADRLLAQTEKLDPNEDRVLEDLVRGLLELRRRHLRQHIDHLRYLMVESQSSGDTQALEYLQMMKQYSETRDRLDKALGYYTSHAI